jgi:hypothetical protein
MLLQVSDGLKAMERPDHAAADDTSPSTVQWMGANGLWPSSATDRRPSGTYSESIWVLAIASATAVTLADHMDGRQHRFA